MSNQENNQENDNNKVEWYSSTRAETGFLNALKLVEVENGSDYFAIKFAARRGSSKNPKTAAHSVRVNGFQAKEVIAQIADKVQAQLAANKKLWDAEKGKEALTILITLNISDTIADSYTNQHNGKRVNYIDGRCTSIAYVRIGDEVIFQKDAPVEATATADVADTTTADAEVAIESDTQEAPVDTSTGELAQEVTLDPKAEDFQARKIELKEIGYSWNADKKVWSLK